MNQEELAQVESSQRQHFDLLHHQEITQMLGIQTDYTLFAMLRPTLKRDGDMWCCLYGENLQEGIAGFGETPYEAILEWNKEWHRCPTKNPKEI